MELYQRIESLIGKKLEEFATEQELVLLLLERVSEAQRMATMQVSISWCFLINVLASMM